MSHTKEPWHVAPGGDYCDIVCQDHVDIARTDVEEDARRIVACVNACIGLETEMLLALVRDGTTLQNIMGRGLICLEQRDELLAALEDAMIMIWRIKKHCQITDNAGYTLDGRMLKLTDVEQSSSAAIANTRKAMGKCYYAPDGTLMNSDGTRSIFDDVDQ